MIHDILSKLFRQTLHINYVKLYLFRLTIKSMRNNILNNMKNNVRENMNKRFVLN